MYVPVPADLKVCNAAPTPKGSPRTQRDVALFITELVDAHADCEIKLKAVVDIVTEKVRMGD